MQLLLWMPLTSSQAIPILSSHGDYQASFQNNSFAFINQLKYLKALDDLNDKATDPWDTLDIANRELWEAKKVIRHHVKNGKTEVKVAWNDPNKSSSWIDMHALAIQDPTKILKYAKKSHLLSQKPFSTIAKQCIGESPSYLARAFKAKVSANAMKYKFGVRVPFGVKQAMQLDKESGTTC